MVYRCYEPAESRGFAGVGAIFVKTEILTRIDIGGKYDKCRSMRIM